MRNIVFSLFAALALTVPAAAKTAKAEKAQVTCKDGSTSKAGRGACSHHGGVAGAAEAPARQDDTKAKTKAQDDRRDAKDRSGGNILGGLFGGRSSSAQGRSAPATPRRDTQKGTPTARCKDGTLSYSAHHSGTCSGHGGVDQWL